VFFGRRKTEILAYKILINILVSKMGFDKNLLEFHKMIVHQISSNYNKEKEERRKRKRTVDRSPTFTGSSVRRGAGARQGAAFGEQLRAYASCRFP
jgi:hypothetical protein